MNALDVVILLILIIGAIAGLRRGLIAQVFSIAAILLSAWLSYTCSSAFGEWLADYVHAEGFWIKIIAFLLIFIGVGLLCRLLSKILEKIFSIAMLGWLNRVLGAVLAVAKYALVIGLAIILFNTVNQRFKWVDDAKLAESQLYTTIKTGAYSIFPYFQELLSGSAQTTKEDAKS